MSVFKNLFVLYYSLFFSSNKKSLVLVFTTDYALNHLYSISNKNPRKIVIAPMTKIIINKSFIKINNFTKLITNIRQNRFKIIT